MITTGAPRRHSVNTAAPATPDHAAPKSHDFLSRADRRVLLVASDRKLRERNAAALRTAGYQAAIESDAEAAWAALGRHGYELLVLDHHLPGESGLRFVLRMRHANLTLPVILVTEASILFDLQTHQQLHSVTLLSGPFEAERLVELVHLALLSAPLVEPVEGRLSLIEPDVALPGRAARRAHKHDPS